MHHQVDYVLTAENNLAFLKKCSKGKCFKKFGNKSSKNITPNRGSGKWDRLIDELIYLLWGGIRWDSEESIERLTSYDKNKK